MCELYGVPAGAAERVQYHVTGALVGDAPRHELWSNTKPTLPVKLDAFVESIGKTEIIFTEIKA